MDPVTYCHVAEHPTEEDYYNTVLDAIAEANGLQKLSLKEKEESEK
jgi:transcription elongation factor Elf1